MLAYIVLLWVLFKLHAPIWCFVVIGLGIGIQTIDFILDIALKISEKATQREQEKLAEAEARYEELKRRVGSNRE